MIQPTETADRIRELLERNLQEVFGEGDPERRRAGDRRTMGRGRHPLRAAWRDRRPAAIDRFAGDLRATHPDFVYTPHGRPQVLHNAGRLAWGSGRRGEAPDYTGWDVITIRNGKISALYVFLDEASDEFRRASDHG